MPQAPTYNALSTLHMGLENMAPTPWEELLLQTQYKS